MNFYLYDDAGRIHSAGYCPDEMVHLQKKPGLNLGIGVADIETQYVDGGELVYLPPRPDKYHYFDYAARQWVPDYDAAWASVRAERNRLLQESDWTQLPDVPIDTKDAWAVYRQQLRDVTDQPDPFNIIWPIPPN